MDIFERYSKECDLTLMKLNNYFESECDRFDIQVAELKMNMNSNGLVMESESKFIYESFLSDLVDKAVKVIDSIIKAIKDFIGNIREKFMSKEMEELEEDINTVSENMDKIDDKEKADVYDDERYKKMLDEYLRNMLNLERKLMNLKVANKLGNVAKDGTYIVEFESILREMDQLNDEYDKEFLKDNKDIIKMASKDAVRFSQKQLKNIKVDYDAIEKGSNKILQQFKNDANGCEVPVKLNILQKMSNSVSTRVRKTLTKITTYKHRTLKGVLALASVVLIYKGIGHAPKIIKTMNTMKKTVNQMEDAMIKQAASN